MANQVNKQQTFGNFVACGRVKGLSQDSFVLQAKGKNNPNWTMNKMNIRLEDSENGSFFMNTQDGFDIIKGKDLYLQSTEGTNLIVKFADRMNEHILEKVDERSLIKVGYDVAMLKNETGKEYPGWLYKDFTCVFDLIGWLKNVVEENDLIKFTGSMRMNVYNGECTYQYEIQRCFIQKQGKELPEGFNGLEPEFTFNQTMLLDENSVNTNSLEKDGVVSVTGYIYNLITKKDASGKNVKVTGDDGVERNAKVPVVYPMQYTMRAEDDKKKETLKKLVEKFMTVEEDTVKKIRMAGKFKNGYIKKKLTVDELPEDIVELIEMGLYTEEEALKLQVGGERIREMILSKPVIEKDRDGNLKIDIDVKTYVPSDIHDNLAEMDQVVATKVTTNTGATLEQDDIDLLSELDEL